VKGFIVVSSHCTDPEVNTRSTRGLSLHNPPPFTPVCRNPTGRPESEEDFEHLAAVGIMEPSSSGDFKWFFCGSGGEFLVSSQMQQSSFGQPGIKTNSMLQSHKLS